MAKTNGSVKHDVLRPILHDKKPLRKGDSLVISPEDAKPLIESGHLKAPKDEVVE